MFSVTLVGNVGNANIRENKKSGQKFLSFSFACETGYGENKKTVWVQCSLNGPESVFQHVYKGRFMFIRGDLTVNQYEDDKGEKNTMLHVFVDKFRFLDKNIRAKKEETNGNEVEVSESEVQ